MHSIAKFLLAPLIVPVVAMLALVPDIVDVDDAGTGNGDTIRTAFVKINALNQLMPWDRCIYSDDFAADSGSMAAFNGGTVSYDSSNNRVQVTTSGSARGAYVPAAAANISGKKHIAVIDVTIGSGDISLRSRWGIAESGRKTVTESGKHYFEYTADGGSGGFGDRFVIAATEADTFYINSLHIFVLNDTPQLRTDASNDSRFRQQADDLLIYSQDYSSDDADLTYISNFGGTAPTITSGQLRFAPTASSQVLTVSYAGQGSDTIEYIDVFIDFEYVDTDLRIQPRWSNTGTVFETDGTGSYHFRLRRVGSQATAALNNLCITSTESGGGDIRINRLVIREAINEITDEEFVQIGNGAGNTYNSGAYSDLLGVSIGKSATSNQQYATVIGYQADGTWTQSYAGASASNLFGGKSGNEQVVIGEQANGGGWRVTAVGAESYAGGQSSTALGGGAVALSSHGLALGRGSYVPDPAQVSGGIDTVLSGDEIYFENSWGHKFSEPISNIAIGDKDTPSNITITLHGQDALDSRYAAWDSGTTYADPANVATDADYVQHNNKVYKSVGDGSLDVEPGVDSGWESDWEYVYDLPSSGAGSGVPSSFNVDGGHIALAAGRSTGTGTGGSVKIQIADGTNLGQNTKQALVDGLVIDSDYGGAETPLIIRENDGTMLRVEIGPADSAGTGYRALRVLN